MNIETGFAEDIAVSALASDSSGAPSKITMTFSDNTVLSGLYGEFDQNLAQIEAGLGVDIGSRGNVVTVSGSSVEVGQAQLVLEELYGRLKQGLDVEIGDVEGALRMVTRTSKVAPPVAEKKDKPRSARETGGVRISVRRKTLLPRSPTQSHYIARLQDTPMVFGIGPAGTGKTYLAVAQAVSAMLEGKVDKIILSRPAVEAGENLGFLPGDMREKVDPYLRPLYDALDDLLPADYVERRMQNNEIEIAPLAFMRGRTLSNAFVILDEAQNATVMQMKMFLTRFGENSQMVIAGDPSQVDLPPRVRSGLAHAVNTLSDVKGVATVRFKPEDVVRHPLVGRIVDAYDAADKAERGEPTAPRG